MNEQMIQLILTKLDTLEKMIQHKASVTAPLYMSITDAAKRYGMSRNTLYELIALDGSPRVINLGAKRLLSIAEWDDYVYNFDAKKDGIA